MSKNQNCGKMKQWRREARKHNGDATDEAVRHGDIKMIDMGYGHKVPAKRVTHQGRRNKSHVSANIAAPSNLFMGLMNRANLINREAPQP
jgi:hypothetical protein